MQKAIQGYVLTNWERLMSGKPKPAVLETLQITNSHGKGYGYGRIVHILFEKNSDKPMIVAKFTRESGYEKTLEREASVIKSLAGINFSKYTPRVLGLVEIEGKHVLFQEVAPGVSINVEARNIFYRLGEKALIESVGEHLKMAAGLLRDLRTGTEAVPQSPVRSASEESWKIILKYTSRLQLGGLEERFVHGVYYFIQKRVSEKPVFQLVHGDFIPSNIYRSKEDESIKIIDWEFSGKGWLGFLDTMRFVYYYYAIIQDLGVLGKDGFHDTFITGKNWLYPLLYAFSEEVEKDKIKNQEDFRTLMAFFLIYEACLQMDVTGVIDEMNIIPLRARINNITGLDFLKEREDLLKEIEVLKQEVKDLKPGLSAAGARLSEAGARIDELNKVVETIKHSKSWRIMYPVRRLSAIIKCIKEPE